MSLDKLLKTTEGQVLEKLEAAGFEGYFVGGCVRDAIMDVECNDIDITTSAMPEEVEKVFEEYHVIETGIKHGTVTVMWPVEESIEDESQLGDAIAVGASNGGNEPICDTTATGTRGEDETVNSRQRVPIEITTFRVEGEYSDCRHPDKVEFVRNVREDLARRDFTMNAIAIDRHGNLVDPFGGREDINKGIIRTVGDAHKRFEEDALRIMRAVRFQAQLGFVIEPKTRTAMEECRHLLNEISVERSFAELKKLVIAPFAATAIRQNVNVLGQVIPHFKELDGFDQHNYHHHFDVLEHCIRCMQNLRVTPENQEYMKLAGLWHDIGKPETFAMGEDGWGHCFGHPSVSEKYCREILKGFKADTFTLERVCTLVKYHDLIFRPDPKLLKRWLNKFGEEVLFEILEIKRADNIATGHDVSELIAMFDEIRLMIEEIIAQQQCFSMKDLAVNGRDVMAETGASGKAVGDILEELLALVINEDIANERGALLEEAVRIHNMN